ncbi:hypothetical protein [Sphaerotilus sp.]|uniref:hypothetical protein n=1 Tax=Sphaerotilus sp. TaxID=2093942 RepID=UPI00286DCCCF|nr:hypothetical protein [Sphaerotilus sp.]
MFRPSRPSLHWLLWLVIALLPLRGWAMAQMAVAPVTAAHHAVKDMQQPCHAEASSKATPSHAGCSLCEVCHASLGLPTLTELHLPTLPHAAPAVTPITGVRDGPPGELFRPPRRSA